MSLFSNLRLLYRPDRFQLEDFHTEIVAQVLRNSPPLTLAWLRGIGITTLENADYIHVGTQEEFEKLATHATASRPDITIRLVSGRQTEFILIESKLQSKQGHDQLQRYADHLEAAKRSKDLEKTSLVFITRDYEAAATPQMANPEFKLTFQPTRWFQFYRFLKIYAHGDGLAEQLKQFMEENRMSLGNIFRSTDLVALENFSSAKALMDETLDGEVRDAAWNILGGITSLKKAPNQLRDELRYIIYSPNWNHLVCMIGYWLPEANPDQPVWVGVTIYCNPSSEHRSDIIDAFRDWLKKTDGQWEPEELDNATAWSSIYKGKPISQLLAAQDHVRAIKDHFLNLLKEVELFRKAYPHLPWATIEGGESADERDET
jgi:hypothetical protein